MAFDKSIRTKLARREPAEEISDYIQRKEKLIPLRKSVANLTIAGVTSMEEFLKLSYYVE